MSIFNGAQSFWIDPSLVQGASTAFISAIELFFKSKPNPVNNSSGLTNPGVSLFITETAGDIPVIDPNKTYEIAHVDYSDVGISSDASDGTLFRFTKPVPIPTSRQLAFVLKFDHGAAYVLWKNKAGELLVGTTTTTPGATGTNSGRYFDFVASLSSNNQLTSDPDDWRPQNDTDLKYRVFIARFYQNGNPVGSNADLVSNLQVHSFTSQGNSVTYSNGQFLIPPERLELITFDQALSVKESFVGAQMAYMNTFSWPGGYIGGNTAQKISVVQGNTLITANAATVNGAAFNWANVFNNYAGDKWVVLKSNTTINVRRVTDILSNTEIIVDEPTTFTNTLAEFLLTPVGRIDQFHKSSPFGVTDSFLILTHSSANSTLRFVNNVIESISISAGGTGYNNADIVYINGWESVAGKVTGGYRAQANITTNSSGGITAIYLSNSGAGFVNTSTISLVVGNSSSSNTTSNTANGTGLTLSYTIGATIKTELRANNNFRYCNVVNIPISDVLPFFELDKIGGADYVMTLDSRYERQTDANTLSGYVYYIDTTASNGFFRLDMFRRNLLTHTKVPALVSRSNEFVTGYSNGSPNDLTNTAYSTQVALRLNIESNNDFNNIFVNTQPTVLFAKYLINNDYEGEEGDRGNAWAKGLTRRISFKDVAEDLIVYLTAYKPANTDIQVYARIYNNQDPEAIDDKQWTRLKLKDGIGLISSASDPQDYLQLTYGFQAWPNTEFSLAGSTTVSNNESNLIGVGTTYSSNLVAGDMIRIYPTLFPNTSIIAIVNSVTNATHLVINTPITNNSFLGTSLSVDKVEFPYQAFNNIMNDNVVRYYNTSKVEFDGYHAVQVKLVMLSDTPNRIPRIDDIQGAVCSP